MPIDPEPMAADSQNECNDSNTTAAVVLNQQPTNSFHSVPIPQARVSSKPFLRLIAQRLNETSDAVKRRKMENVILKAISSTENE